jgi:hypothetical protein
VWELIVRYGQGAKPTSRSGAVRGLDQAEPAIEAEAGSRRHGKTKMGCGVIFNAYPGRFATSRTGNGSAVGNLHAQATIKTLASWQERWSTEMAWTFKNCGRSESKMRPCQARHIEPHSLDQSNQSTRGATADHSSAMTSPAGQLASSTKIPIAHPVLCFCTVMRPADGQSLPCSLLVSRCFPARFASSMLRRN